MDASDLARHEKAMRRGERRTERREVVFVDLFECEGLDGFRAQYVRDDDGSLWARCFCYVAPHDPLRVVREWTAWEQVPRIDMPKAAQQLSMTRTALALLVHAVKDNGGKVCTRAFASAGHAAVRGAAQTAVFRALERHGLVTRAEDGAQMVTVAGRCVAESAR